VSQSSAITGASYVRARSFSVSVTTSSSTEKAIAKGGYALHATGAGCWVKIGPTGVAATNGDAIATQPDANAPNGLVYVPQDGMAPLDVDGDSQFIAAITASGSATLRIVGPIGQSARR
jgi:hypothetical protein